MAHDRILSFGPYRLDAGNAQLWREGQPVRLTAKALQVLSYLAERPHQLVTKDELFEAVWPETVVSDATLASNIQAVRQALSDDSRNPQYIETVHRRGFRFVAPVAAATAPVSNSEVRVPSQEEVDGRQALSTNGYGVSANVQRLEAKPVPTPPTETLPLPPPRPSRLRWWQILLSAVLLVLGGVLAANWRLVRLVVASYFPPPVVGPESLPLPDKPSIAVLPFVNLSGDSSQEYFSDGLTAEITSNLSQLNSLFVIARTSAFTYKGKPAKVPEIGRELGVRYVLEGSVQKLKDQIRISAQLIDATNGGHLWTEHYERPLADIFAVQDEIVRQIVTTLKLQLTMWRIGESVRKRTHSMEAYDLVLRAMERFWRLTKDDLLQSRKLLEHALTLDPQYAYATFLLGGTYFYEWWFKWNADPHTLDRAWEFAQRAVILDDSLPDGHRLLAGLYVHRGQINHAITEIEQALALEPNNADTYETQTAILIYAGRPTEGLQSAQRALRLNPHGNPVYHIQVGWAYQLTERYDESIAALKHAIARSPLWIHAYVTQVYNYVALWGLWQSQDPETLAQAYDVAQNALALNNAHPFAHTALGYVYLWKQQYDDAIAAFERAVALDGNYVCGQMMLASGLSQVGRVEEAVQVGERALKLKALPSDDRCLFGVASAYARAGRLEAAVALEQRLLKQFPNFLWSRLHLAAIYGELGREAEARVEVAEILRINPQFSLDVHKQRMPIKDSAMLERHIAALRKAGLK